MEATLSYLLMLKSISKQSKKNSGIKYYALCLGNVSENFTINNMKRKTGLKGVVNFFSVNLILLIINDTLDIHKYLMKRT